MIVTGAARSIIVKLAYQSGFEAPLTITLLYLLGQSLSLVVHYAMVMMQKEVEGGEDEHQYDDDASTNVATATNYVEMKDKFKELHTNQNPSIKFQHQTQPCCTSLSTKLRIDSFYTEENNNQCIGSVHGLNSQAERNLESFVQRIPFHVKPAVPAIFSLLNYTLRWTSLLYIDASVAEMMISGLELILSVVAARVFRQRRVAKSRWVGVFIVAFGVFIIEYANGSKEEENDMQEEESNQQQQTHYTTVGVMLIVFQSILSVLEGIAEEIFLQASTGENNFPATLMFGYEGLYGLVLGLIIYTIFGSSHLKVIEDVDSTISTLRDDPQLIWWLVGLPFLFLVTGIFNIKATEVTSAMTRNVWKNLRAVLVWCIALAIYYLGGNPALGEDWHVPESFYILLGFFVMFIGIVVYYFYKEQDNKQPVQRFSVQSGHAGTMV